MAHARKTMHRYALPSTFRNARMLRTKETEAEKILWENLRDKRLDGIKFRRQHPMDKYVVDFFTQKYKFAIELDGGYHEEKSQKIQDADREENIASQNILLIRFSNEEVLYSLETVLNTIRTYISWIKFSKYI